MAIKTTDYPHKNHRLRRKQLLDGQRGLWSRSPNRFRVREKFFRVVFWLVVLVVFFVCGFWCFFFFFFGGGVLVVLVWFGLVDLVWYSLLVGFVGWLLLWMKSAEVIFSLCWI